MIKLKQFPKYSENFLRRKCTDVKTKEEAQELKQQLEDMFPVKKAHGVACPQIGISKRAFLARFPSGEWLFACNAEILKKEEEIVFGNEGCLSFPNKRKDTIRYNRVQIRYFDEELEERNVIADGMEAIILQHEIDHTNGILYKDRTPVPSTVRNERKVGRNETCPCGSGRKFKKCCIDK